MSVTNNKNSEANIFSKLEFIYSFLLKIIVILPLFLFIGILYQFINLIKIDRLNFFSWSQVINDTVSLFFPTLFGFIGIFLGININVEKTKSFFSDFFFYSFIIFIISLILYGFNIFVLYETLIVGYFSIFIGRFYIFISILTGSEKMKSTYNRKILTFLFCFVSIIGIFNLIKEFQYKGMYIKVENIEEKVLYMNDRYIITYNKILHNKDDIILYYKMNKTK